MAGRAFLSLFILPSLLKYVWASNSKSNEKLLIQDAPISNYCTWFEIGNDH